MQSVWNFACPWRLSKQTLWVRAGSERADSGRGREVAKVFAENRANFALLCTRWQLLPNEYVNMGIIAVVDVFVFIVIGFVRALYPERKILGLP